MDGSSPPIRVLIADDDEALRVLLGLQLAEVGDVQVVGSASTGRETLTLCEEHHPDAAVLDLHLPGGLDGAELIQSLHAEYPGMGIVAYTASAGGPSLRQLSQMEVELVMKGDVPKLIDAVRASVAR
jgi:DNA-binding NarL/FixJ family response regulator